MAAGSIFQGQKTAIRIQIRGDDAITYSGRITEFDIGGLDLDVKTVHQMGQTLEKEMPRSEGIVSFNFTMVAVNRDIASPIEIFFAEQSLIGDFRRYDFGSTHGPPLKIVIDNISFDPTATGTIDAPESPDGILRMLFYNVKGTEITFNKTAGEFMNADLSFLVPPEDHNGSPNFYELWKYPSGTVGALDSEESTLDSEMGGGW